MSESGLEAQVMERAALVGGVYAVIVLLGLATLTWFLIRLRRQPVRWSDALSRLYWRPLGGKELRQLTLLLGSVFLVVWLLRPWLVVWAEGRVLRLDTFLVILQSVLFHWVGLAAVAWILFRRRLSWRSAFGMNPATAWRDAARGWLILLGTMPLLVVATLLVNLFLTLLGFQPTLQDVAFVISGETALGVRLYLVLLAVVLAPLFEEILFRGILLPFLAKRYGATAAVIALSLLFAGIHGHLPSLVPLFILSCALCLAYIGTGSLVASIAMHALFNGVTVSLLMAIR